MATQHLGVWPKGLSVAPSNGDFKVYRATALKCAFPVIAYGCILPRNKGLVWVRRTTTPEQLVLDCALSNTTPRVGDQAGDLEHDGSMGDPNDFRYLLPVPLRLRHVAVPSDARFLHC